VTFVPAKVTKPFAPGHHPSDSLRSSLKPAQKELGIFDPSNTFLLFPAFPAVLGGVQSLMAPFSTSL